VTGGSRGIGLAIARRLAESGHELALVARDEGRLAAAAAELGPNTTWLAVDLTGGAPAMDRLLTWLGSRPVEVLVNNAGIAPTDRFETTSDAVLRTVLELHVEVPFRLIRALLPGMRVRAKGKVIQLASTAGLRSFPFTAAYTAAKHGMVGVARALIAELGQAPIRVHAVCPGFVDTDITRSAAAKIAARGKQSADEALTKLGRMNALGRMHTVDEVAGFVADLVARDTPSGVWDLDRDPPTRVE
jgi:NAD(P)-dependent dehydrogenase (short-subunit alcohol dehydrogenase family)